MKNVKCVFKYGRIYDPESKMRIILDEDAELTIQFNDHDVLISDPNNKPFEPRMLEDRLEELRQSGTYSNYKILLPAGSVLRFSLKGGVVSKGLKTYPCQFEVRLIEELIGVRKTAKGAFGLVGTYCVVSREVGDQVPFFEPIHAYSLNNAYSKTFNYYFSFFGAGTANAKTKFSYRKEEKWISLSTLCQSLKDEVGVPFRTQSNLVV